jgi:outer membrane biosynthesis protein TonB
MNVERVRRSVGLGRWFAPAILLVIASLAAGACVTEPGSTPAGPGTQEVQTPPATLITTPTPEMTEAPTPELTPEPTTTPTPTPAPTPTLAPTPTPAPTEPPVTEAPAQVDPYAAAKAAGATAVCADGTLSFSKTRSGTCSGHKGVHWWTGLVGEEGPGGH